eukprot:5097217-Amphidinium_carterae.1
MRHDEVAWVPSLACDLSQLKGGFCRSQIFGIVRFVFPPCVAMALACALCVIILGSALHCQHARASTSSRRRSTALTSVALSVSALC